MARPTLFTHRKFARLAADIGSEAAALGHLEFIWAAAGQSGDDLLGDARDVELAAARPLRDRRTEIEHAEVAGVRVLCAARVKNQRVSEGRLHRLFEEYRIDGEWLAPPSESVREKIIAAVRAEF